MFIPIYFLILLVIFIITLSITLASDKEKRFYDSFFRYNFDYKEDEFLKSIKIKHNKWRSRNFRILLIVSFLILLYFVYFVIFNSFNFIAGDI